MSLINYIRKFTKELELVQILSELSGISVYQISKLLNGFKSDFREYPDQCPFQKCSYKTDDRTRLKRHLANKHDIGFKGTPCHYA